MSRCRRQPIRLGGRPTGMRCPQQLVVTGTAILMLTACQGSASSGASRAPSTATAAPTGHAAAPSRTQDTGPRGLPHPAAHRPLVLLPRACTGADLRVDGRHQEPLGPVRGFEVRWTNRSHGPCWLGGAPTVRTYDPSGAPSRFPRQVTAGAPATHVVLPAGATAYSFIGTERCDYSVAGPIGSVRIRLPMLDARYRLRVPRRGLTRCSGSAEPDLVVTDVSLKAAYSAQMTGHPSDHVALRADDRSPPLTRNHDEPTYGRGDLDGDGRADLVVERPDGLLVAHVSGLGVRTANVQREQAVRLEGLTSLTGDAVDVLAGSRSADGDEHATSDVVLRLRHGRLEQVRYRKGSPLRLGFEQGHGDAFSGIRCGTDGSFVETSGLLDDHRLSTYEVTVRGVLATRRLVSTLRVTGLESALDATATRCPGLDRYGEAG